MTETPAEGKPPEPPAETLREDEEAADDAATLAALAEHRNRLELMPDDPRPSSPGSRPNWRRRTYVVDWKLQLSYAGLYVATITLFVVGFAAVNLIFLRLVQFVKLNSRVPSEHWWQQDDIGFYVVLNFVIVLFVAMGMALWAIVQSHRIAGPALRFRRAFRQMMRRDYDFYLQLRKNDFLKDLAVELNGLNNALKAKDLVLSDAALRLEAISRQVEDPVRKAELREVALELADLAIPLPAPEPAPEQDPVAKA